MGSGSRQGREMRSEMSDEEIIAYALSLDEHSAPEPLSWNLHKELATRLHAAIARTRQYKCERCGHEWFSRSGARPRICPRCKSAWWDTPKGDVVRKFAPMEAK